jgi:cytochrome c biogenesis protein
MRLFDTLIQKLAGVRLTILLCILLALVSLIGTLIPQNLSDTQYANSYGPEAAKLIVSLGFSDIYHSIGFVSLLSLLAINLLTCSTKRFPNVWRALRRGHAVPADRKFKSWKNRETFVLSAAGEDLEDRLEEVVSRVFGKRPEQKICENDERVFFIERRRYARYGPYVAHLGILIILLGGVTGLFLGFKGSLTLPEGQESSAAWARKTGESVPLGFRIRCDRFIVLHYPSGAPKEYRSEVSLLDEEGTKVMEASIRVNHPLTYRGITFYQSNYGKVFETTLRVRNLENGQEAVVTTELNKPFLLPGDQGMRAMAVAFQEDLRIPAEMVRRTSFSGTSLGPAVRLVTLEEKGFGRPFWVLKKSPESDQTKGGGYHFVLEGYRSISYTGLQVARDPGAPLVWAGCILLLVGFLMALLLDHEIFWIASKRQGPKKVALTLAGRGIRHPAVYHSRFERQKARLRKELAPWFKGG